MKLALYLPNFRDKVTVSEIVDLAVSPRSWRSIPFGLWTVSWFGKHPIARNYASRSAL